MASEAMTERETDYAVAERVMQQCAHREQKYYCVQSDSGFTCKKCGDDMYGNDCPRYSTDIKAAFEMQAEIERRGESAQRDYALALTEVMGLEFPAIEARIFDLFVWAIAHASPMQRCLAALDAATGAGNG